MPVELSLADLDLSALIKPGDTVVVGQGTAEPLPLTAALVAQRERLGPITLFLGACYAPTWAPEHADTLSFVSYGRVGESQRLARAGKLAILPSHMSELPALFERGALPTDVVLVQLSQDEAGRFSFGAGNDYLPAAMKRARVVIAEINTQAPWTYGSDALAELRIDYVVRTARPLAELPRPATTDIDQRIALHAARYIEDGAVIETGVGAVPDALLSALGDRRHLGIHSGMIGDGVAELMAAGVIDNSRKRIDAGRTVAGALFGTRRLFDFAHLNPDVWLQPVNYTHDARTLSRHDGFIAVNSAIEVDITGQVNAEMAEGNYLGAVGGQLDFVRAALQSPGGRSIIALRSTARGDSVSSIVLQCSAGCTTTPRSDADVVVTEWGAAELRGKTLPQRARALLAIAHPKFKEMLERNLPRELR